MTRFDIRLRRQQFKESRMEQYKNYHSLLERHEQFHRKRTRGILVMVAMLVIVIALMLALFHQDKKEEKMPEKPGLQKLDNTAFKNKNPHNAGNEIAWKDCASREVRTHLKKI